MIIKKNKNSINNKPDVQSLTPIVKAEEQEDLGIFDAFSEVTERQERRRGDRRRGYRRIEDRNLVSRAHEEAKLIKEQAEKDGFENGLSKAEESLDELKNAIKDSIKKKDHDLKGKMASEGTTPRQLTDLLGSLCDLTSGSGDKGTPIILIQGYFDNYTND